MKKNVLLALLCGLFVFQAFSQEKTGYTINGEFANSKDGMKVWILNDRAFPQEEIGEPVEIKDGKFQLTGSVDAPMLVKLVVDTEPEQEKFAFNILSSDFYLENSDINVKGDINTMQTFFMDSGKEGVPAIFTGSKEHDLYLTFEEELKPLRKTMGGLYDKYFELYGSGPTAQGDDSNKDAKLKLSQDMLDTEAQIRAKQMDWIRKHPATTVSIDQFNRLVYNTLFVYLTQKEIEELETLLVKNNPKRALEIEEMAEFGKYSAIGNKYTDIEIITPDGEKANLSEYIPEGKYVLVEFWDSGCKPCRAEIPHLKTLYEQYKDKGFDIVHISKDQRRSNWLKALEQEQMPWSQVGEIGVNVNNSPSMKYFCAKALPTSILLDNEGRFFKKDIRGEMLDVVLREVFGE